MRSAYRAGGISQGKLARQFKVSQEHVSDIIRGRRRSQL